MHKLKHNQLQAPIYRNMVRYVWYAAKLITFCEVFCNVLGESESMRNVYFKILLYWLHCSLWVQLQAWTLHHCEAVLTLASQLCCCSGINMAASLSTCTKEEQSAVIWFLWAEGIPVEINRRSYAEEYCWKVSNCCMTHCHPHCTN
jgi:hypothetical protein